MELDAALQGLPAELRDAVAREWGHYVSSAREQGIDIAVLAPVIASVPCVWAGSAFVVQHCVRAPGLLADLVGSGDLERVYAASFYGECLTRSLGGIDNEAALARELRLFRSREMLRIAWRDLAGWADLQETLRDLSNLASACLDSALRCLDTWQAAEWGVATGARSGARQGLVVVGMGKLGAGELNFSSDIDLIFAYPEDGETVGGARTLSNEDYFRRLAQRLIQAINAPMAEGFVFRVDMLLRPFVFRRYLDFGAYRSLREMKALIEEQVKRKGMEDNVKLGAGGIREIEFIGQAFQLIRGGRETELQARPIVTVLHRLVERGYLPAHAGADLVAAYEFLRRAEHRLQEYADQQTHRLPQDATDRARLAYTMGHPRWEEFARQLDHHRRRVHSHFEYLFAAPEGEDGREADAPLVRAWRGGSSDHEIEALLAAAGYSAPAEARERITHLRDSAACRQLTAQGRERLDYLMPLLLAAVAQAPRPEVTLGRVLTKQEKNAHHTTYLALLAGNTAILSQLVRLCAASPWIATQLTRLPLLLDELLDPRALYQPLDCAALERELAEAVQRLEADDLEQQMEALRHFKQNNVLRVAAADEEGVYPLMIVSDHLTEIAEVSLRTLLRLARAHLTARHGAPQCRDDGKTFEPGFAIVGYGKLGGIELGYGSDLDLVFLHGSVGEELGTQGAKPIDNAVYFARVGQRIIHMATAHTPSGVLYEIDMRLRPSGTSGLLVSSFAAFADYQRRSAWTWEHQALVRARVVAGDPAVAAAFESVRREVLSRPRDREVLRREVREMRQRMRDELGQRDAARFDLKQDAGGIADIEFMVQYAALAWACEHPELLRYTDNIRLLEVVAGAGLMAAADAQLLSDAYRAYRASVHQLTLQDEPALVAAEAHAELRAEVLRIWRALMEE